MQENLVRKRKVFSLNFCQNQRKRSKKDKKGFGQDKNVVKIIILPKKMVEMEKTLDK